MGVRCGSTHPSGLLVAWGLKGPPTFPGRFSKRKTESGSLDQKVIQNCSMAP
jgi:hypothetical protein